MFTDELMFRSKGFNRKLNARFGGGDDEGGGTSESVASAPAYQKSPYHDSASAELNNFYTPRIRGEQTGLAEDDLANLRAGAIDNSNYLTNEAVRRGAAGRRTPGGVNTGGQDTLRESAVTAGLQGRSNALRDIATQNALLKHQDQWNAATGMQSFLNQQDQNALGVSNYNLSAYSTDAQMDMLSNMYGNANNNATNSGLGSILGSIDYGSILNMFSQNSSFGGGGSYGSSPDIMTSSGSGYRNYGSIPVNS